MNFTDTYSNEMMTGDSEVVLCDSLEEMIASSLSWFTNTDLYSVYFKININTHFNIKAHD